jgi:hypothetical protein
VCRENNIYHSPTTLSQNATDNGSAWVGWQLLFREHYSEFSVFTGEKLYGIFLAVVTQNSGTGYLFNKINALTTQKFSRSDRGMKIRCLIMKIGKLIYKGVYVWAHFRVSC